MSGHVGSHLPVGLTSSCVSLPVIACPIMPPGGCPAMSLRRVRNLRVGRFDDGDAVLIGRALYLPQACAADEEHRELAGVPEEVMFATKPQLAGALLDRAQSAGIRAAFVAGDEVYSGRQLRRSIRQREMGYVLAVRANHSVTTRSGRTVTPAAAARMIPAPPWHPMRPGPGPKATRPHD